MILVSQRLESLDNNCLFTVHSTHIYINRGQGLTGHELSAHNYTGSNSFNIFNVCMYCLKQCNAIRYRNEAGNPLAPLLLLPPSSLLPSGRANYIQISIIGPGQTVFHQIERVSPPARRVPCARNYFAINSFA